MRDLMISSLADGAEVSLTYHMLNPFLHAPDDGSESPNPSVPDIGEFLKLGAQSLMTLDMTMDQTVGPLMAANCQRLGALLKEVLDHSEHRKDKGRSVPASRRRRGAVAPEGRKRAVERTRKRLGHAAGPSRRLAGGDWGGESRANRPERRRALLASPRLGAARARARAEAAARRCPRCWRGGSWSQRQRRAPLRPLGVSASAERRGGRWGAAVRPMRFGRGAAARRTARTRRA